MRACARQGLRGRGKTCYRKKIMRTSLFPFRADVFRQIVPQKTLCRRNRKGNFFLGVALLVPALFLEGCGMVPSTLVASQPKPDMRVPYPPTLFKNTGSDPDVTTPALDRPIGPSENPAGPAYAGSPLDSERRDAMQGSSGRRSLDLAPSVPAARDMDVSYGPSGATTEAAPK